MSFTLSVEQFDAFQRDGYVVVKGLFDAEEVELLLTTARNDVAMNANAQEIQDSQGQRIKIALWNHPGDDIFGLVGRCHRVVDTAEALLGDEVYHYHSKLSIKEPRVGGAWEWHQDYGYWYQNGCLFPDMLSCVISLDPSTMENGCMQVLKGSHKLGRIEHQLEGEQTGADKDRVAEAAQVLDVVHAVMDPGDALFLHCNTLHCSIPNASNDPRWLLICCYNTKSNNPYKQHHHPQYTPLDKVPDESIKAFGIRPSDIHQEYLQTRDDDTTAAGKDQGSVQERSSRN